MITLTSDFGLADTYVAQMKGVIYSIHPSAKIVDITHEISKFNIQTGAFMLVSAASCFPKGTVHVAIVDPGVGTKRRPIVIKTKRGYFIGPDNGLLILAAERQSIQSINELTNPKFMLPEISGTFHGRDVFAPAAAYIEKGVKPERFGPKVEEPVMPEFTEVKHEKSGSITCRVLHVDSFGNIITNLPKTDVPNETLNIKLQDSQLKVKLKKTYGDTKPKEPLALIGSHGFLEIAVNRGNASEKYQVKVGIEVTVTPA